MEALSSSRRTTRGGLFLDIFPISFLEPFFARRSAEAIDEWSRFLDLSKALPHWANHITNYICVTIGLSVALYLMGTRDGGRLSTRGNRRRSDKGPPEG